MTAVETGADALGFVFAESPRRVDTDTVNAILKELPPFVTTVGVFAGQPAADVVRIIRETNLNYAQLHGAFDDLGMIGAELGCRRLIRSLRLKTEADLHDAAHACPNCGCAAVLLDAHVEGVMGGTGKTFDWNLALKASSLGKPIIMAGGLTSSNVAEAVRTVRPYAVDVSTGVESAPGKKDPEKVKEFIFNAKSIK
jgi:phosphoribosylanthranilate isomerase